LEGAVILPISALNRVRRDLVYQLEAVEERPESSLTLREVLDSLGAETAATRGAEAPALSVLCRSMEQVEAALEVGVRTIYLDFEDVRRYREAVESIRARSTEAAVFLA